MSVHSHLSAYPAQSLASHNHRHHRNGHLYEEIWRSRVVSPYSKTIFIPILCQAEVWPHSQSPVGPSNPSSPYIVRSFLLTSKVTFPL